jgi:MFS family permease
LYFLLNLPVIMFAIVYGGMALTPSLPVIFILFSVYGVYAASTESVSKAWISNISNKQDVATAIGFYTSFGSLFTMLASVLAGFLWSTFNPSVTFIVSSVGALLCVLYFKTVRLQLKP